MHLKYAILFPLCAFFIPGSEAQTLSYLSLQGGVFFPIRCYHSTHPDNPNAGYAKPGFKFTLQYTRSVRSRLGLTAALIYFTNPVDRIYRSREKQNHYQSLALVAGPSFLSDPRNNWHYESRLLAGIAKVLTPELRLEKGILLPRQSVCAFTWQLEVAILKQLTPKDWLLLKADHQQLKPQFKHSGTRKTEQHMLGIGLSPGAEYSL